MSLCIEGGILCEKYKHFIKHSHVNTATEKALANNIRDLSI